MEHPWLFYVLFFLFGYVTCRTFYFMSAVRKSAALLRVTQAVALFTIVRGLEHFHYAKEFRLATMKANDASQQNIRAFLYQFEDEMNLYKTRSVHNVIDAHGSFFKELVEFTDWKSAMTFLEGNKDLVETFITKDQHD